MSPPVLRPLAAFEYQQLGPIADRDAECGYPLAHLCAAMWAPVEDLAALIAEQPDGTPGWALLLDPDRCPARFLPHLAQRVGVTIPAGTPETEARALIRDVRNWNRGTIPAMVGDVQATLTGTRYVHIVERDGGPHDLTLYTRSSETPDPAKTLAAATAASRKRIGLRVTHSVAATQSWREARLVDDRTWAQLLADYPTKTWAQARTEDIEVP